MQPKVEGKREKMRKFYHHFFHSVKLHIFRKYPTWNSFAKNAAVKLLNLNNMPKIGCPYAKDHLRVRCFSITKTDRTKTGENRGPSCNLSTYHTRWCIKAWSVVFSLQKTFLFWVKLLAGQCSFVRTKNLQRWAVFGFFPRLCVWLPNS